MNIFAVNWHSPKVLVMRRGEIVKEFQRGESTEADILCVAIGKIDDGVGVPAGDVVKLIAPVHQ